MIRHLLVFYNDFGNSLEGTDFGARFFRFRHNLQTIFWHPAHTIVRFAAFSCGVGVAILGIWISLLRALVFIVICGGVVAFDWSMAQELPLDCRFLIAVSISAWSIFCLVRRAWSLTITNGRTKHKKRNYSECRFAGRRRCKAIRKKSRKNAICPISACTKKGKRRDPIVRSTSDWNTGRHC